MTHPKDQPPSLSGIPGAEFDPDTSGQELEELEAEVPILTRLRDFTREADRWPWFAHLGEPIDRQIETISRRLIDGLGFPDAELAPIVNWDDAAAAAQSLDWDTSGWEAEEQLRAAMTMDALDHLSEEALNLALTHLTAELQPTLRQAIEEAASLWDEEDEGVLNAATGAALQAAHGAALAIAAGAEGDHPLLLKYELFTLGRWPVGLAGLTFNLF